MRPDLATTPPATRPAHRTSAAGAVGRPLLLAILPASLIWYPVGALPGLGNVALSDLLLIGLWVAVAAEVTLRGMGCLSARAALIPVLAAAVCLLAGIGSALDGARGLAVLETLETMKRFGMAAIVPAAVSCFGDRRLRPWLRVMTAALLVALAVFTIFPELQQLLPTAAIIDPDDAASRLGERASGLVTNPNDLAYCSVALSLLHAALLPARPRAWDRALLAAALLGGAVGLVASGSRSGLMGATAAVLWLLASSALRGRTRALLAAGAAVAVVVGLALGTAFSERLESALRRGTQERNVASRLAYQQIAVEASVDHPLGVGFRGFERATGGLISFTDNVYTDTLLAAGYLGLLTLLAIFAVGWRGLSGHAGPEDRAAVRVLQAGVLAFAAFGLATVVPISIFLAPTFFSILGAGELLGQS